MQFVCVVFKLDVGSSHFVVWLDLVGANLAQVHLHFIQSCSRECGTQRNLCHVPVALTTIIYSTSRLVDFVMHLEHGSHNTHDSGFVGLCSREIS